MTEVPVQYPYSAVDYGTDSKQQTTQSGADSSPHDFRHRNWVWGGLSRSNATTPRPGLALAHPWPAIHRTVLYASLHIVHPRPETKNEKKPTPTTPTSTGLRYVLLRYARTSPKQNLSTCPKPKDPGYRLLCFTYSTGPRRLLT